MPSQAPNIRHHSQSVTTRDLQSQSITIGLHHSLSVKKQSYEATRSYTSLHKSHCYLLLPHAAQNCRKILAHNVSFLTMFVPIYSHLSSSSSGSLRESHFIFLNKLSMSYTNSHYKSSSVNNLLLKVISIQYDLLLVTTCLKISLSVIISLFRSLSVIIIYFH